jgi:hypothetical protein
MTLLRWSRALLAVLVLAGCKKEEPAPPPPPEPAPTAKAPGPSKHAATGVGSADTAPPPPPMVAVSLSYLKSVEPERCEWVRQPLPAGAPTTVFTFDAACDRSMVSWSPDAKEGLVFTWPSQEGEVPRAWRVDLAAHTGKPLDLSALPGGVDTAAPDKPSIEQLGFDKQGHPVAILSDVYTNRTPKKVKGRSVISFEGKDHPLEKGMDGLPGLAHAYRLEGEGWKRIETKVSTFEAGLAPGTAVLEALKTMPPIAKSSPAERMPGQEASEGAVKKLDAAFPGQDESGQWMEFPTPGGTVYFRGVLGGEFLYPSVPVRWEQDGKLVELEGLKEQQDDFLNLQLQEGFLLIINYGDPRSAQVWDVRTQRLVLSAEGANAPAFWPAPAKP